MGKKELYTCSECGYQTSKWLGRCPQCQTWNSFERQEEVSAKSVRGGKVESAKAAPLAHTQISPEPRFSSGFTSWDRLLGGGFVKGSAILLGGDPGIGKSTLLLQMAIHLTRQGKKVLYCSGEESAQQIKMRSLRLSQQLDEKLIFYPSTAVAEIQKVLAAEEFAFVIIDSIQTAHSRNHSSGPGSVAQVRESAYELRNFLEGKETVLLFIAHVTKEGSIAGPKLLEHLVDAVFYFEGERFRDLRLIRAFKNRFGQVNDIAIFQMTAEGLVEIQDPTGHFLEDEEGEEHPGIAISAVREGSLILVVEIQALASEILYQAPKRATDGLDLNRLQLLAAVLDKYAGMALRNYDLFVKIAGGVMVSDPAVDLALLLALASSFYNRPVTDSTLFVGEVSLSGQIRPVNMIQERMQAAQSMGFRRVMLPDKQKLEAKDYPSKIIRVGDVTQALATVF